MTRKTVVVCVVSFSLCSCLSSEDLSNASTPKASGSTVTLNPHHDAYVSSRRAEESFGDRSRLYVDGDDAAYGELRSFLSFSLPERLQPVEKATLRLYVVDGSPQGPEVHRISSSWRESRVNWNNQPDSRGRVARASGAVAAGRYLDLDVTSTLRDARGEISFLIVPRSNDGLDFESKEGARRPQLVLETSRDTAPPRDRIDLEPAADAYVNQSRPSTNNGGASTLLADGAPDVMETYLRFSVPRMEGPIRRATLRLYVTDPTPRGPRLYRTSASWQERELTWNNKPRRQGAAVPSVAGPVIRGWQEFDLTSVIRGSGSFSFAVVPNGNDGIDFTSRESRTSPRLTIITGGREVIDGTTLDDKVMAGYQGWFMAQGDGSGMGWRHWSRSTPRPSNVTFDMWPDLREFPDSELFDTRFRPARLTREGLYSAYTPETVDRHVRWMKDHGIDGVFVQRFLTEAIRHQRVRDRVLDNVRVAAERHGRVFVNMYDISGADGDDVVHDIKADWKHLVDNQRITQSDRYLHHRGRPLLAIWGFGAKDRPGSGRQAEELIRWLTRTAPERYRVTLMGGVDDKWRSSDEWRQVIRQFDVVSPWSVGRYRDNSGADRFLRNRIRADLRYLDDYGAREGRHIDYMPVVFPGFSWHNLKDAPLNHIPRRGGRFFWRQVYNAVSANCNMIYVAMFDEVDEGTAMFKIAENRYQTPEDGTFLTLDADGEALPSDWYLQLMGEASRMVRAEIPLTSSLPIRP